MLVEVRVSAQKRTATILKITRIEFQVSMKKNIKVEKEEDQTKASIETQLNYETENELNMNSPKYIVI